MMSAPTKPTSPMVVLPSIREMFPEHLMDIPPPFRTPKLMSQGRPLVSDSQQALLNPGSQIRPRSFSASSSISTYSHETSHSQRPRPSHMPHMPQNRPLAPSTAPPTPRGLHAGTSHAVDPYSRSPNNKSDSSTYSFGVLRSDPSSSSLQHITSSTTFPNRSGNSHGNHIPADISNGSSPAFQVALAPSNISSETPSVNGHQSRGAEQSFGRVESGKADAPPAPSIISFPVSGPFTGPFSTRGHSPNDTGSLSDEGDLSGSNSGKKHICTTCFKRFNRPSSLRIHVNTHTGATPFRCPWPNCGREFNVNSNMRRHLRNHTTPGFTRSQSNDNRRRRRRGPSSGVFMDVDVSPTIRMAEPHSYVPSPPISTISMSEDSDGDASDPDPMDDVHHHNEEDELDSPDDELSSQRPTHHLSRSHTRSFSGPNYHSSSTKRLSHSPQPEPIYNPSAPYVRSLADPRVSTALRPAFHSTPVPARPFTKQEPTSVIW